MINFNILDLFSGAGGFSLGLEKNKNFKTKIVCDYNQSALKTFSQNFKIKSENIVFGDISKKSIQEKLISLSFKEKINMIIGGPPCQGFSNKGKKSGKKDKRNFLFIEFFKIVEKVKPLIFIIENVKTLKTTKQGYFFDLIQDYAKNLNYIVESKVLNAKNFNIPQNRERIFIIGIKKSLKLKINLNNIKNFFSKKVISVKEAISDLNFLNSNQGKEESKYLIKEQSKYQKNLRKNSTKLFNHISTNHTKLTLEKLKHLPINGTKNDLPKKFQNNQKFKNTWSRLSWTKISPTIDTRFDTPSNGQNTHPELNRAITPREAARIQSFPDIFRFFGKKTEIRVQIGNAVPPILAEQIGKLINQEVKNTFKKPTNSNIKVNEKNLFLYNDDALKFISYLESNNILVDHIITDPPYNISIKNNFSTMKKPRKGIYFGDWDNNFNLFSWIPLYSKIIKKNGSFIIFCSYRYISFLILKLEENNFIVKDILLWKKTNPMPRNINRRYVQDTEFAIWAVKKGSKWTFNKPKDKKYLRSEFITNVVSKKERLNHPTQKSIKLMNELIKIHTNENDLILDPFMGTGTTGLACLENKRKFIGVEKDKSYFKTAFLRLKKL